MRPQLHMAFWLATTLPVLLNCISLVQGEQPAGRTVWIVISGGAAAASQAIIQVGVPQEYVLYNYNKSFHGFAALLTRQEAGIILTLPGVASVFENKRLALHTTRSWTLLGLSSQSPQLVLSERKLVIGVMDTGIWQDSESLRNFSATPILAGEKFYTPELAAPISGSNNGKAKYIQKYSAANGALGGHPSGKAHGPNSRILVAVNDSYLSALDFNGHGTLAATIAAGNAVAGANLAGLAAGEAQGGVPGARIGSYKVCWGEGTCDEADVLAAFDDAISHGVHVLSLSFGGPSVADLFADAIALGSFYATQKGIVVVCSVGNNGPDLGEATNVAPWVISVAASSIDRQFYTTVLLGNNVSLEGRAINTEVLIGYYPLIHGSNAGLKLNSISSNCSVGSLDPAKVKGKLVVCDSGYHPDQSSTVYLAGGVGMIIIDISATEIAAFTFGIPTSVIGAADGDTLQAYLKSSSSPTAKILPTKDPLLQPSNLLAAFSSRGPSRVNYQVFKPDITAPGVSILGAWSGQHSISNEPQDHRNVSYNIATGTSIACPHVAGAAAYVKIFRPDWSVAAIKSALMTTALPLSTGHASNAVGEFGFGAGLIQPLKAISPGLLYDIDWEDYAEWLCGQGYDKKRLRLITKNDTACTKKMKGDLNYAAISLPVEGGSDEVHNRSWSYRRTVTNVGASNSVYKAEVELVPEGMEVVVRPAKLSFSKLNQKKTFVIKVQVPGLKTSISPSIGNHLSAYLVWNDGVHKVRSPIVAWIAPNALQDWPRTTTTPSIGFRV